MAFKIYTRTGDQGETGLFGGKRVLKDNARVEAYGVVDELNAFIGMVRDHFPSQEENSRAVLLEIQNRLFTIGGLLASDPDKNPPPLDLNEADIQLLETTIDQMEEHLEPLKNFILPGGHPLVSHCHIARCVCRRAERRVVSLDQLQSVDATVLHYLNRLSDFLFVLGRYAAKALDVDEVIWQARS